MNLDRFQTLCIQRLKGEKTELECLREMREVLTPAEGKEPEPTRQMFQFFYDRLVDVLEDHHLSERELLSNQIESWLLTPTLEAMEETNLME